ncbi:hypothetical protein BD560DRAFT_336127 [Blakeslea trispora]|nr:hypothetical protein BD560DRAFT_342723 [Blakeslea trispora]KAI8354684.1 hypothetical protein BD560DRAFT_336127 [Blakeslea trispora]
MLFCEITDANIYAEPFFRITGRTASLESRCMDSGSRVKLYMNHPALMYYFIRFGGIDTRHCISGALHVSAYTFDDSTKAYANIRVSVVDIKPIWQVDDDGNVIRSAAKKVKTREFPRNREFVKMKFIVYKHIWEHIGDSKVVNQKNLTVEPFALELSDMYADLGK